MTKQRKKIVLFTILFIMSLTSYLIFTIHEAKSDLPDNYIRISCSTRNYMSLEYFKISLIAFENNTVILWGSSIFEAIGKNPILLLNVESTGSSPSSLAGEVVVDVRFYIENATKNYFVSFSEDSFVVDSTLVDGVVKYDLNLSEKVEQAKSLLGYNGSIDSVGVRGRLSLGVKLRNPIGTNNQRRFTNVIIDGNANFDTILFDFQTPQIAKISEAIVGNQIMKKSGVPYRVETSLGISPLENFEEISYLEWEVPEEPLWLLLPPYSWILSAFVGAVFVSIPLKYISKWYSKPKLSIKIPARGRNEPAIHPINGIAFYHLSVENNGRTSAIDSELALRFKNQNGVELFQLRGKWDSGPEPIGPIIHGQATPMPALIPFAERTNIRKDIPEPFCIVIKDNQPECYAFNCDSYFHGFKNRAWQLPIGNFIVEVEVKSGNANKRQQFLLRNKGNTIQDIEIQNL
jgi:hypothetical protein